MKTRSSGQPSSGSTASRSHDISKRVCLCLAGHRVFDRPKRKYSLLCLPCVFVPIATKLVANPEHEPDPCRHGHGTDSGLCQMKLPVRMGRLILFLYLSMSLLCIFSAQSCVLCHADVTYDVWTSYTMNARRPISNSSFLGLAAPTSLAISELLTCTGASVSTLRASRVQRVFSITLVCADGCCIPCQRKAMETNLQPSATDPVPNEGCQRSPSFCLRLYVVAGRSSLSFLQDRNALQEATDHRLMRHTM